MHGTRACLDDRGLVRAGAPLLVALAALALLAAPAAAAPAAAAPAAGTTRVSVSSQGTQGNGVSGNADRNQAISADGRVVAFFSEATGLAPRSTSGDVVVRDLSTGRTRLASVSTSGALADNFSGWPSLDATGRRVAFLSYASNLVPGDTNGLPDVFVHDRQTGTTTRVSVTTAGAQVDGAATDPEISADGRYVAFASDAKELLAGTPPGGRGASQVFVHDLVTGSTRLVSATPSGAPGSGDSTRASVSADGSRIAYQSDAPDLVPGDTNAHCTRYGCSTDVFVRDVTAGSTVRADVRPDGSQGERGSAPSISADGTRVAMLGAGLGTAAASPAAAGTADAVYVRDLSAGSTTLASRTRAGALAAAGPPALSGDGRRVAFTSEKVLVAGDTNGTDDVFVRDLSARTTARVSVSSAGAQGDGFSTDPDIDAAGDRVVFVSAATTLVPGDTNTTLDVFLHTS